MRTSSLAIIFVGALCIVSTLAAPSNPALKAEIARKALSEGGDITSGIIDGMSYVAGNPQLCSKAHGTASDDFVQGTNAFARAFSTPGNVLDFENGLRLYGLGLASVADSMQFCGLNTIVSNWTAVANQIGNNPGRGVANLMNSMSRRIQNLNLGNLVPQITQDLDNGLNYAAGVKIGTIVATILTPNVPNTNYIMFLETMTRLMFLIRQH